MTARSEFRSKVACLLAGFTLGGLAYHIFFDGKLARIPPPFEPAQINPSSATQVLVPSRKPSIESLSDEAAPSRRSLRIDPVVAAVFWSPPVFDMTSGEFQLESFLAYGLPVEKAQRINQIINSSLLDLNELEVKYSTIKTEPNGDQYFVIKPFPDEGSKLKNKLREGILKELKDAGDDRGVMLADSLAKHQFFAGFGENRIELSVQGSSSGGPDTINVKSFINSNGATISRQWLPGANYVTKRFQALIDKNK
jgi:hypothetical protein